jgi:hypothetical protein
MAEESDKTKGGDSVDAIEKFFLDLVGTIVPGCVFLLLGWLLFTSSYHPDWKSMPFYPDKSPWIVIVGLAYVIGHGIASVGEFVLVRVFDRFLGMARKLEFLKGLLGNSLRPVREVFLQMEKDPTFTAFVVNCRARIPTLSESKDEPIPFLVWRSLAMSFAPGQRQTVYRFMFLSLLNLGVGTSLVFAATCTLLVWLGHSTNQFATSISGPPLWAIPILLLAALPFLERRYYFYRISTAIPFGMALAELSRKPGERESPETQPTIRSKEKCVYLAGGFHSGWQGNVTGALPGVLFMDPRKHGLKDKAAYTLWDLEAIRRCDLVFAYLEEANPGGYALALEVGFAKALGKRIIFVNEKGTADPKRWQVLHMIEAAADVHVKTFEEGLNILKQMCDLF